MRFLYCNVKADNKYLTACGIIKMGQPDIRIKRLNAYGAVFVNQNISTEECIMVGLIKGRNEIKASKKVKLVGAVMSRPNIVSDTVHIVYDSILKVNMIKAREIRIGQSKEMLQKKKKANKAVISQIECDEIIVSNVHIEKLKAKNAVVGAGCIIDMLECETYVAAETSVINELIKRVNVHE